MSLNEFQFEGYLNGSYSSNESKGVSDQYFALLPTRTHNIKELSSSVALQNPEWPA